MFMPVSCLVLDENPENKENSVWNLMNTWQMVQKGNFKVGRTLTFKIKNRKKAFHEG